VLLLLNIIEENSNFAIFKDDSFDNDAGEEETEEVQKRLKRKKSDGESEPPKKRGKRNIDEHQESPQPGTSQGKAIGRGRRVRGK
jgi:hypothetical protein